MSRLLLVDGHSNLYRAFYGITTPLAAPDGTPTAATYGFLRMQHKMLRELDPSHVAVAFDVGKETFRTRMDERYKAHRPPMPDKLRVQVPLTQDALRLLGLAVLTEEDVEADDVIGTLAIRGAAAGLEVIIASTDKDLMQLVKTPGIRMWHTRLERLLDEDGVAEVFGVPPQQIAEVLAIMGDSSDNVPGCPGIGEKGALDLIRQWGTVDRIYAHLDEVTPPRRRQALIDHRDEVELSRELVRIHLDLPIKLSLEDLRRQPMHTEELAAFYQRMGFTSLLVDLGESAKGPNLTTVSTTREEDLANLAARLEDAVDASVSLGDRQAAFGFAGETLLVSRGTEEIAKVIAPHMSTLWCHDGKRLISRLRDLKVEPAVSPRDTMLAGYLLAPGESVELPAICHRMGASDVEITTLAGQAAAIAALATPLQAKLTHHGLMYVFENIELPLVPVLEDMERQGIRLDPSVLEDLSRRLSLSLADLERDIHAEAGGPFNINSPQQLAEVLFQRRGLPVLRKTQKTKAPSTDADVLQELAARGYRLPALILDYREQTKLKSTYVDALPRQVGPDGRIHTRFNQAVAATGRLSSSEPNLQNIPIRAELGREVRRAFVAAPGQVLIAADYSQIELRVLAHLAQDPTLHHAFAHGDDIHTATAALVFGIAPELVGPDQRRAAKTINFGLIYGMGAFALGRDLGVTTAEAQRFIDAYFERLPKVRGYLEGVKEQARQTGMVRTLFGRVRFISGLDATNANLRGNAERQAINAPVQGTAADLIKLAMINLFNALRKKSLPARLVLQVHDELIVESEKGAEETVAELMREIMQNVAVLSVPLQVDVGIGDSWASAKG